VNNSDFFEITTNGFDVHLFRPVEKDFYLRSVLKVAKELLGKILVRKTGDNILAGKIVEVEAYRGKDDQSAHSFGGKTERNSVMFEEGGLLYVYLIYGIHYCANIVTGKKNEGNAVLIRALEPLEGIEEMFKNRFLDKGKTKKHFLNLTNGPAKLCQAFGITRRHNGTDLGGSEIYILEEKKKQKIEIVKTTRIGISKSKELEWRFYVKDNPFVSVK